MKSRHITALLFVFAGLLSGCFRNSDSARDLRDLKGVTWSPEFAAPLINSELSLADIIKQAGSEIVETDPDGLIHLIYRGELISIEANDVLRIGDQTFNNDISLTSEEAAFFAANDSVRLFRELTLDYSVAFGEIDSVYIRYMKLIQTLSRNFDHEVVADIRFPGIRKGALVLKTPVSLPISANSANINLDLFNYFMDLSSGTSGYNQVPVELYITIRKTGADILLAGSNLTLTQEFEDHDFDLFYGYAGKSELLNAQADTMILNVFSKSTKGTFTVDDPRIKLSILNSFGIPARANILQLRSFSETTGFLNITGFPSQLNVEAPGQNEVGKIVADSIVLNKNTSNIADIINSKPDRFIYQFNASCNPDGPIRRNFAARNSALTFRLDLDFPLKGTAQNYALEQTQSFNFDLGDEVELEEVVLRLNLENEFPIDLDFQVYFLGESDEVLDSLFSVRKLLISSPPVDVNGRTNSSTKSVHDISYNAERVEHLKQAVKYQIVAGFNTTKGQPSPPDVAFYDDYTLKVKLGVAAAIKVIGG